MSFVGPAFWKIQTFQPQLCDGCTSMELCEKYGIDIRECGYWFPCTDTADSLDEAIDLARSLCSFLDDGNNVRIVRPDGKIL